MNMAIEPERRRVLRSRVDGLRGCARVEQPCFRSRMSGVCA